MITLTICLLFTVSSINCDGKYNGVYEITMAVSELPDITIIPPVNGSSQNVTLEWFECDLCPKGSLCCGQPFICCQDPNAEDVQPVRRKSLQNESLASLFLWLSAVIVVSVVMAMTLVLCLVFPGSPLHNRFQKRFTKDNTACVEAFTRNKEYSLMPTDEVPLGNIVVIQHRTFEEVEDSLSDSACLYK